jgi:hypothetical protein
MTAPPDSGALQVDRKGLEEDEKMVATFEWDEQNGASPGSKSHGITNGNWGNVDDKNIDTSVEANKIPRGENSYSKYISGHFSGSYTQIGPNGKLWKSAGSLPSGVTLKAAMTVTYATPTKTSTGDSDIPTEEGSALAVQFGATEATATNDSTTSNPAYSKYYRSQLQTTGAAPTGAIGTQTATLKYDES